MRNVNIQSNFYLFDVLQASLQLSCSVLLVATFSVEVRNVLKLDGYAMHAPMCTLYALLTMHAAEFIL